MRKYSIILLAAAMGLLAACVKEQPSAPNMGATLTVRISSEAPAPQPVKTHLGEVSGNKRKVYWSDDDAIRVNGVASEALSGLADNVSSATFTFPSALGAAPYSIFYPADKWTDATHITLPAQQTYKAGSFADGFFPMAGYSADGSSISIHHLCAILKVNILRKAGGDEHDLVSVTFRGLADEQVSGNFELDYQNATLTATSSAAADKEVKVVRVVATSTVNAASYYVVVPAGTYASGIAVDIQDQGGDLMTVSKTTSVTFEAGMLYDMSEIPFEPTGTAPANLIITTAEELIQFAADYNSGALSGDDLLVALGNNISFNQSQSDAFNLTGGIGAESGSGGLFNGLFDGAGYSIDGLKATVPVFARMGKNGTVKDLTIGATSSVTYSDAITANLNLGAIVGYCKGDVTRCKNYAPVNVSSTSREDGKIIYLGGIVGRQNETGTISGCENHGAVTCTTSAGDGNVYMGGIAGSVERPSSGQTALIQNCLNSGTVKNGLDSGEPAQAHILHMGGIVGWINSTSSSSKMIITGLENTGSIIKTNNGARADAIPVVLGGIVGGIHGAAVSSLSGQVAISDSRVKYCTIQSGAFNNSTGYGEALHAAGFVGVARGENANDITFTNCSVKSVDVITRRGLAGGFASIAQGVTLDGCQVITSAIKGSLAQLRVAGGLVAFLRGNCTVTDCIVTLTKDARYSLYGNADTNGTINLGGLVGNTSGTNTLTGNKVFVKLMYVGTNKTEAHGWIVGNVAGTLTIENCGLGGSYGDGTPSLTLDASNFGSYINGNGSPTLSGNYYWDGSDAPGNKIVSIVIADYATANNWESGSFPQTIVQDGVTLTASHVGTNQNGNYNIQWRFYQARGGGLTVSVPSGHTLVSATFTYDIANTGVLIAPDGTTQVPSGTPCLLSGNSAFFTVGNTGTATNGQCRFTAISVEYE